MWVVVLAVAILGLTLWWTRVHVPEKAAGDAIERQRAERAKAEQEGRLAEYENALDEEFPASTYRG